MRSAVDELESVVATGDQYAQHGDWLNAATVYETIMREVLGEYESVQDEEGDLSEIVNRCVVGLGKCLNAIDALLRRQHIVRTLLDVYRWDVEFGGIDMGYPARDLMLKQTTPGERQQIIGWTQQALPTGNEWSANWHRQVLGRLLLDSQKDTLDDEAYLAVCRETGRIEDLVDRLLKLDRLDEGCGAFQKCSHTLTGGRRRPSSKREHYSGPGPHWVYLMARCSRANVACRGESGSDR